MTNQTLFDGETYSKRLDGKRLYSQLARVRETMQSGHWFTLEDLARECGGSVASISALIRDLRKVKFGGLPMQGRRVPGKNGLWEYRMESNEF